KRGQALQSSTFAGVNCGTGTPFHRRRLNFSSSKFAFDVTHWSWVGWDHPSLATLRCEKDWGTPGRPAAKSVLEKPGPPDLYSLAVVAKLGTARSSSGKRSPTFCAVRTYVNCKFGTTEL